MKYEFNRRVRNKFNFDSPVCLLGQLYHSKMSDSIDWSDKKASNMNAHEKFKRDFHSRIWMTYRKDYPRFANTDITTDIGWGCMIRSGQMILAQALLIHFKGREWRWSNQDDHLHNTIIKWFADYPEPSISPFSIHEFVRLSHKKAGDWFGPASISFIFKRLLANASKNCQILSNICCYVARDCTVYLQDVLDLCLLSQKADLTDWRSVIIMVPVRLGGNQFNPIYGSQLKHLLSMPCCLGIIGGKPRHSLYFVGFQNEKLIAIDPHYCQKSVNFRSKSSFSLESYHCRFPQYIPIDSIDPSCSIGFYLKNYDDYVEFIALINQFNNHSNLSKSYPIFSLSMKKFDQVNDYSSLLDRSDEMLHLNNRSINSYGNDLLNSEEFVVL
ncbi:Cysteine protease ATG4D [Sarcoptes scabiei]|uniref:Cysteine protease n=1 Tax=Sarcoptes scabiei TaxID=52283 RepID=A0A834R6Q7_SARSC|nr:Cysteine protease ATG4D [Sarcoptes scabiei]